MRRFRIIVCVILVFEILLIGVCNFLLLGSMKRDAGRQYRVDISRASDDLNLLIALSSSHPVQVDFRRGETPADTDPRLSFDMEKYPSLLRVREP